MPESSLVTRDPATGLRCTPTRWTHTGEIPTPDGCRWCGEGRRGHGRMWKPPVGWHKWTAPTDAQRLARMKARRAATLTARTSVTLQPDPNTIIELSVADSASRVLQGISRKLAFMAQDVAVKEAQR
jgi:hypothetical protein